MKKFAVIVGGGKGIRLGGEIPKQFLPLRGLPVIFHTIEKFSGIADEIVLVLPESHFDYWNQLCLDFSPAFTVTLVAGGTTRSQSVMNGLRALTGQGVVAVHDAVRPLVSKQLVTSLFQTAMSKGSAIPVISLKESIRKKAGELTTAVNRDEFLIVQTPQCFDLQDLKASYEKSTGQEFTDDAGLAEHFGIPIHLVEGESSNIKITFPEDMAMAEILMDVRKL